MESTALKPTTQLRRLLAQGLVMAPGVHDGISAKLVQEAGFPAIYVGTGSLAAAVYGRPDIELITLSELMVVVRAICESATIPVIVDADTGFGGLHNVIRTVREMESAGVAAIHLEDQPVPKRCGYFEGGGLLPIEEMVEKIQASVDARRDPDFMIIARVDGGFISSFDEALERARAYQAAGADMVFVNGMSTVEQARRVIAEAPGLHLYNVSGSDKAPFLSNTEIEAMGYRLAIYPLHAMRLAAFAMRNMFAELKRTGNLKQFLPQMINFQEYQRLTGASAALELETQYAKRREPPQES